jgi:hypothetical protein
MRNREGQGTPFLKKNQLLPSMRSPLCQPANHTILSSIAKMRTLLLPSRQTFALGERVGRFRYLSPGSEP